VTRSRLAPVVPFGWFDAPPSLNRLLGVQWLARLLHPTLFPEPLAPVVKAFHARHYHRPPTDAQVQTRVRESGLSR
jgi:iron complex transport system substrate-binding protein